MDPAEFEKIALELLDLLDRQVAAIVGRNFNDLTKNEVDAYQSRRRRILELRSTLAEFLKGHSG
jgi:hypothetical protein